MPHSTESLYEGNEPSGYRERSLWASLGAVALVDTAYFFMVVQGWLTNDPLTAHGLINLCIAIVVVLLVIEVGFAFLHRGQREAMDERDQLIAAEAARQAYGVFVASVMAVVGLHLLNAADSSQPLGGLALFDVPFFEVHLILASLVTAELIRYGGSLWRYRQGH